LGVYYEIAKNPEELTIKKIALRIQKNKEAYLLKFEKKS